MEWTRRRFLTACSGLLAGAFLSACSSGEEEPEPGSFTIPAAEIPKVGDAPLHDKTNRFFLINNDDGLLAFSAGCTHRRCNIQWKDESDKFRCPCHSSMFNRHGEVESGPAPRPLDLFRVTAPGDGSAVVTTGPVTRREQYSPDQSVPVS